MYRRKRATKVPFPYMPEDEYRRRIQRAKELMGKYEIDGVLLFCPEQWIYYFGFLPVYEPPYVYGGILPREADPIFMAENIWVNHLELESYVDNLIGYTGHPTPPAGACPDPVNVFVDAVKEVGLGKKRIGLELGKGMYMRGVNNTELQRIQRGLSEAKFVDASDMIWEQRMIKTPWEQELMRKLCKVACKSYLKGLEITDEGVNERDILNGMLEVCIKEGIVDSWWRNVYCNTGRNLAVSRFQDHKLKRGDVIFFDGGPTYKGYQTDMQRIVHIGEPSERVKHLAKASQVATEAVWEMIGPGVPVGDLVDKSIEAMTKFDSKLKAEYYITWIGHGQGLWLHEPPWIVKDNQQKLEPGMIISIEILGADTDVKPIVVGDMPEDMFLITEKGYEWLTSAWGPPGVWIK